MHLRLASVALVSSSLAGSVLGALLVACTRGERWAASCDALADNEVMLQLSVAKRTSSRATAALADAALADADGFRLESVLSEAASVTTSQPVLTEVPPAVLAQGLMSQPDYKAAAEALMLRVEKMNAAFYNMASDSAHMVATLAGDLRATREENTRLKHNVAEKDELIRKELQNIAQDKAVLAKNMTDVAREALVMHDDQARVVLENAFLKAENNAFRDNKTQDFRETVNRVIEEVENMTGYRAASLLVAEKPSMDRIPEVQASGLAQTKAQVASSASRGGHHHHRRHPHQQGRVEGAAERDGGTRVEETPKFAEAAEDSVALSSPSTRSIPQDGDGPVFG